jgi:TRAP-type uncharacterized transport system substrate-binding protein
MATRERALFRGRYLVWASVALAVLFVVAVWLTFALLQPTPPRKITMVTGPEGGISAELGKRYREFLKHEGIDLRLVQSPGAVAMVAHLRDRKTGASVAIVADGIATRESSPELVSLGALFYEPLWLFYHGRPLEEKLRAHQHLRIAVGPEGSGSRAFSVEFLARTGIVEGSNVSLLTLASDDAAKKLQAGEIDAAFLLDAWETSLVRRLIVAKDIHLSDTPRADSWVALYPYLNKIVLPAGVADMARNVPPENVTLLAPKASLLVRADLHPAIQYLLLEAAAQIHSGPSVFNKAGQFPALESPDLPISDNARQFYKTGTPFLQRHLPFWLAILVQQLIALLIPVVALLYPMLRLLPALFGWFMRLRVFRLYGELKLLEDELAARGARDPVDDLLARLEGLEERANDMWLPMFLKPFLYQLRIHISLVRARRERQQSPAGAP